MPLNLFMPQRQLYYYYYYYYSSFQPMSENLAITNFRVFRDKTEFKLAPLTILTGKNSAGKSSVIKALLLLGDYLRSSNQLIIDLHGPSFNKHKMLHFKDAFPWNSTNKEFTFELTVGSLHCTYTFFAEPDQFTGSFKSLHIFNKSLNTFFKLIRDSETDFTIKTTQLFLNQFDSENPPKNSDELDIERDRLKEDLSKLKQEKSELIDETGHLIAIQDLEKRIASIDENKKKIKQITGKDIRIEYTLNDEQKNGVHLLSLLIAIFTQYSNEDKSKNATATLIKNMNIAADLHTTISSIRISHLGPNRTQQSRLYTRSINESEISTVINEYALNQPPPGSEINNFLRKWMSAENFDIADEIDVEMIEGEAAILHLIRGEQRINSADMGFGVGQVLTILLKIALFAQNYSGSTDKKYLLIEEPESNLHPRLQSLLADMFHNAYMKFNILFILETHSEYMVRKCMVKVADKSIGEQHVSISYLTNDNNKSWVRGIKINQDGTISDNFGEGFFDEASSQLFQLMKLNRA